MDRRNMLVGMLGGVASLWAWAWDRRKTSAAPAPDPEAALDTAGADKPAAGNQFTSRIRAGNPESGTIDIAFQQDAMVKHLANGSKIWIGGDASATITLDGISSKAGDEFYYLTQTWRGSASFQSFCNALAALRQNCQLTENQDKALELALQHAESGAAHAVHYRPVDLTQVRVRYVRESYHTVFCPNPFEI